MKYKCPSCFIRWTDNVKPLYIVREERCIFCSSPHTEEELFDWQRSQFKEIPEEDRWKAYNRMLQRLYKILEEVLEELRDKN